LEARVGIEPTNRGFADLFVALVTVPKINMGRNVSAILSPSCPLTGSLPGKPTQNARTECSQGQLREECLSLSFVQSLFDTRRKIAAWRKTTGMSAHSGLEY